MTVSLDDLSDASEAEAYLSPDDADLPRPWLDSLFGEQRAVALDEARFRAVTCSRRGGKTVLLATLAIDALARCERDEVVVYLARTRSVARDLIWAKLRGMVGDHRLRWRLREQELRIDNERGGALLIRGAEGGAPGEELDKLRGLKLRRALADEPATYAETLRSLLRDVIEPALGDLRGDVIVAGTPGPVCAGHWHEISTGQPDRGVRLEERRRGLAKWSRSAWTLEHNPHFPDATGFLASVRADNGWADDDPTFLREYLGQWTVDDRVQVYRYSDSINWLDGEPSLYERQTWHHVIGVDFGVRDECAWVVWASNPRERAIYAVHARKAAGLLPDEAAEITRELCALYRPHTLVGDSGGLGKPYVEQWNRRYASLDGMVAMMAAQKLEKRAHIELLNGELRTGRARVCTDAAALAAEWRLLPWRDETHEVEHPAYANHCADAALYGYVECRAYMHEPEREWHARDPDPDSQSAIAAEWERLRARQSRPVWDDE